MAATDRRASGLSFRVALLGGILGSFGATVGWLLWIAIQAFQRDWRLVLAPVIGAALGFALQWLEQYVRTARAEREGTAGDDEARPAAPPPPRVTARTWALAVGFLAVACENLAGDLMSRFLVPFLSSIATLFPAGALFGWLLDQGRGEEQHPFAILFQGALLGIAAAVLALSVQFAMGAPLQVNATFGWWVLVGIGALACCPAKGAPGPLHTVGGIVVALILVAVCCIPGFTSFLEKTPPVVKWPTLAITSAVDGALRGPEVPGIFWIEAEAAARREPRSATRDPGEPQSGALLVQMPTGGSESSPYSFYTSPRAEPPNGSPPPSQADPRPEPKRPVGADYYLAPGAIPDRWKLPSLGNAPAANPPASPPLLPDYDGARRALEMLERNRELMRDLPRIGDLDYLSRMRFQIADPALERLRILGQEMEKGPASGMARSWIVLLLFAVGVGLGPVAEELLRPRDAYRGTRTHRNEQRLFAAVLVLILAACFAVRLERGLAVRSNEPPPPNASPVNEKTS